MLEASGMNTRNAADPPEGFKTTELSPLPEEWQVVRLEEVIAKCFSGVWGDSPEELEDEGQVLVKVIRVSDIKSDSRIAYFKVPLRMVKIKQLQRYRLKRGDIVVVKSSGSKSRIISGRSAIFEPPNNVEAFIPSNFTLALRTNSQVSDSYFVWYYLLTQQSKEWVDHVVEGSTYPNLKKTEYLMMPIPLPPLPEQRAIAHVLRTVQRAKETTERVIAALKELKKSLMKHLFTYGPVPLKQADQVPLQETEIGPLPAHWQVVKLGEVVEQLRHTINPQLFPDEIFEYYSIPAYQEGASPILEAGRNIRSQKIVVATDIVLFGKLNPRVPKVWLVESVSRKRKICSTEFIAIKPGKKLTSRFLYYLSWSKHVLPRAQELVSGSTPSRQRVDIRAFFNLPIPLPPLFEQCEIARILQTIDRKIEAEENRKRALEGLFKTLLHHLMTAKIRLPKDYIEQFKARESVEDEQE